MERILPFANVGVDYFGPIVVKRGRSLCKCYGVIFTCLSSRAVHLEVANSLDTEACINALRRFMSRRGQVSHMRSDNGTNFVGAERELREALAGLNHSQVLQHGVWRSFTHHIMVALGNVSSACLERYSALFCISRHWMMMGFIQLVVKLRPHWTIGPSLRCPRITTILRLLRPITFSLWRANLPYNPDCLWKMTCMWREGGDRFNIFQTCSETMGAGVPSFASGTAKMEPGEKKFHTWGYRLNSGFDSSSWLLDTQQSDGNLSWQEGTGTFCSPQDKV